MTSEHRLVFAFLLAMKSIYLIEYNGKKQIDDQI